MSYVCQYQRGRRVNIGQVGVITPAQARDRAKEILADAVKGDLPHSKKQKASLPTLNNFINNEYAAWRHANRKSAKKDIDRLIAKFGNDFGHLLLSDIAPLAIDKWRSKRIAENIKHVTVNPDISILKAMLKKAEEWGIINESPLQKFKLARIDSLSKIRYLTIDEEKNLKNALVQRDDELKSARLRGNEWRNERKYPPLPDLNQCSFADHITPMILISLNTGLRQGELFNLKWENINFERAILTVTADVAKSGKTRHIPLNSLILKILMNWQKQADKNELVFSSKKTGTLFNNVKKAWKNILDTAGIKNFRWHDMRHHFASKLVMAGVDLNTVRELLGHADIKMTLRYAHLAPEHKANAVEKLV